jgi:hypothetical protein
MFNILIIVVTVIQAYLQKLSINMDNISCAFDILEIFCKS